MENTEGRVVEGRGAWAYPATIMSRQRAVEYLAPFIDCNMNFIILPATELAIPNILPLAHEHGIEVHAMFGALSTDAEEPHPWSQVTPAGLASRTGCCSYPELRRYNIQKIVSFLRAHPEIDGVHLDWIGFDSDTYHGPTWLSYCYCERCRAGFREKYEIDPLEIARDSAKDPDLTNAWKRYRCQLVNNYAREIRDAIKAVKPDVLFSGTAHMTVGAPSHFTEPYICSPNFQEWGRWIAEGIMEIFFPMPYTCDNAGWREHLNFCAEAERKTDKTKFTYPGIGINYIIDSQQLVEQIEYAREAGVGGVTLFPVNPDDRATAGRYFWKTLKEVWSQPSVLPHRASS